MRLLSTTSQPVPHRRGRDGRLGVFVDIPYLPPITRRHRYSPTIPIASNSAAYKPAIRRLYTETMPHLAMDRSQSIAPSLWAESSHLWLWSEASHRGAMLLLNMAFNYGDRLVRAPIGTSRRHHSGCCLHTRINSRLDVALADTAEQCHQRSCPTSKEGKPKLASRLLIIHASRG